MTLIYFDTCCLNRPFDDQTQNRIHLEAEAIIIIMGYIRMSGWQWIDSEVLDFEIEQIPDIKRRDQIKMLSNYANQSINVKQAEIERAQQLESLGFYPFDALHIACAESGGANIFLTTDDKLLRLARHFSKKLNVRVENPLVWLMEFIENE